MIDGRRIYLDNASTTPIDPEVIEVMITYLKNVYGNPSSLHKEGRMAKSVLQESRSKIANILGCDTKEIIFTSGGTESDNLAIFGFADAYKDKGRHIITSSIEHKAVLDSCKELEKRGFEVTYLEVDENGQISLDQLKSSLRKDTIIVSVMYANNEVGAIQPINKISKIINESKKASPIFHCDACQASGALPIRVNKLGVDSMTISSSKVYGPKGVGCLYVSKKVKINPIIFGGGQENGLRSGTENTVSIAGFSEAFCLSDKKRKSESERLTIIREYFISKIKKNIDNLSINGGMKNRLPNNINVSIRGVEGESLVLLLDSFGIACSTGSACSSMDLNPSHVLIKIGVPLDLAHCSVRFTLGRYTRKDDIDYTLGVLTECVKKIRSMSSVK